MLLLGDCLEKLKELEDNSIDSVVTDPPAGISFMNKSWDGDKGGRDKWIAWLSEIMVETNRVLKPGAHGFVWAIPRTSHWTATAIENSGFEIRDIATHIFGSGFPKSHNIKEGEFKGWGTALKPASEHWILIRKKLEKGLTVKENFSKWGTGGLNIDQCKIGAERRTSAGASAGAFFGAAMKRGPSRETIGRWPANILFDEEAAAVLDAQSGNLGKSAGGNSKNVGNKVYGKYDADLDKKPCGFGDSGGASRFFYVAKASKRERNAGLEGMPEKTKKILNGGIPSAVNSDARGMSGGGERIAQNHHPTVKPIKLMEYLCKLITPPKGTILDPFMGSGSTGVAAKNLGFNFIGCEMSPEYFEIAKKRIGE